MLYFETGKILDQCVLCLSMTVYGVLPCVALVTKAQNDLLPVCSRVCRVQLCTWLWLVRLFSSAPILVARSHFVRRLYLELTFYKTF